MKQATVCCSKLQLDRIETAWQHDEQKQHASSNANEIANSIENKRAVSAKNVATMICVEGVGLLAYLDSQASHSFLDVNLVREKGWKTLPASGEIVFAESSAKRPRIGTNDEEICSHA